MKTLLIATAMLLPAGVFAEEPPLASKQPEPAGAGGIEFGGAAPEQYFGRQVRFDMLVVSVPEAKALELRADLQDPKRIAGAEEKLLKLVADRRAKLIGWPTVTSKSGQRAVVEALHEPYDPIKFPENLPHAVPVALNRTPGLSPTVCNHPSFPKERQPELTLEIDPTIGPDGETVEIELLAQHEQVIAFRNVPRQWNIGKVKVRGQTEQPDLVISMINTTMAVKSGSRVMLGFHKMANLMEAAPADPRIEITILQTTIETVRSPARIVR